MTILTEIFTHKRTEVAAAKQRVSEAELEKLAQATPVPPDFIRALTAVDKPAPRLIAEVKHRSPSKGILCPDFEPLRLARTYAENGAAAISVLTDEKYFGGKLEYLKKIADAHFTIPLLRKDFIFDRYQLLEARMAGASAALLIVAMLDPNNPSTPLRTSLQALISQSHALSLAPLVEVHTRAELDRALEAGAKVIGINNRDLHTFKVSLQTTLNLLPHIPAGVVVVAESGIKTREDVRVLAEAGVDAMLIGEGLVTAGDVGRKVREFAGMEAVIG
ncbi:MAG: indole-3-glycerol phosphate synthase TrpC [Anaerolineales bacterium]